MNNRRFKIFTLCKLTMTEVHSRNVIYRNISVVLILIVFLSSVYLVNLKDFPDKDMGLNNTTLHVGVICPDIQKSTKYKFITNQAENDLTDYLTEKGLNISVHFEQSIADNSASSVFQICNNYSSRDIHLIIGCGWSSQLDSAISYAKNNNMLIITPSTHQPWPTPLKPIAYRLSIDEFDFIDPLVNTIEHFGISNVLVLVENTDRSIRILDRFSQEYKGKIKTVELSDEYEKKEELLSILKQIETFNEDPDLEKKAIINLCYNGQEKIILKSLKNKTYSNLPWYQIYYQYDCFQNSSDQLVDYQDVLDQLSESHFTWVYPTKHNSSAYRNLNEIYKKEYGTPLSFELANLYDACWIMVLSIIDANSLQSQQVSSSVPYVTSKYEGVSGKIMLDDYGDRFFIDWTIWMYEKVGNKTVAKKIGMYSILDDTFS